jgi:cystathionine beta-lyase/cystathionine gamma-synthase
MPYVSGLLQWLESNGAIIEDRTWLTDSYGNLIENGVDVTFESVTFKFICSHEDFLIKRVSGNKAIFWGLCELFKETEC